MNNTEFVMSLPLQHFLSFLCVSCHLLKEAQVSGDYHQNEPIVTGDMGDIMGVNKDISLLSFLPSFLLLLLSRAALGRGHWVSVLKSLD